MGCKTNVISLFMDRYVLNKPLGKIINFKHSKCYKEIFNRAQFLQEIFSDWKGKWFGWSKKSKGERGKC